MKAKAVSLKGKRTNKPKIIRWKEIIKIRTEEKQRFKKKIGKVNESKSCFFERYTVFMD